MPFLFKLPGFTELPDKGARQEMIKTLAQSGGGRVLARSGQAMMAMHMGDPEMAIAHRRQHRRAEQRFSWVAAMHGLMRRQHAEAPARHAYRKCQRQKSQTVDPLRD